MAGIPILSLLLFACVRCSAQLHENSSDTNSSFVPINFDSDSACFLGGSDAFDLPPPPPPPSATLKILGDYSNGYCILRDKPFTIANAFDRKGKAPLVLNPELEGYGPDIALAHTIEASRNEYFDSILDAANGLSLEVGDEGFTSKLAHSPQRTAM
ncbi:hypothetical protein CYMTET_24110 [Cymbomonas tetramitiformis]|uniref:Uncharacterized protein n=1 Tax=Cymbomonas tetramitiformis TaxID=36881 RepID=A0AAE0FWQ7_9CHLO|nr:hypothetical protein CYMTET_24110 [Cymbomonas tetramitiformis]